jgi:hypothetical protein
MGDAGGWRARVRGAERGSGGGRVQGETKADDLE